MNPKALYKATARQMLYLIVLVLVVLLCWKIGDTYKSATVQEYGIFESAQSVVLLLMAINFIVQAVFNRAYRPVLYCLGMLSLAALIREQDAYFDTLLPGIGWSWCWVFPLSGLIYLIRSRNTIGETMHQFLQSNAFHMMVTALVTIIPLAQCLGHRSFLVDLLGNEQIDASLVRRIMEEPIELLGYIQILLASFECMLELRKK